MTEKMARQEAIHGRSAETSSGRKAGWRSRSLPRGPVAVAHRHSSARRAWLAQRRSAAARRLSRRPARGCRDRSRLHLSGGCSRSKRACRLWWAHWCRGYGTASRQYTWRARRADYPVRLRSCAAGKAGVRPFRLADTNPAIRPCARSIARPTGETVAADADAVAHRLAVAEHVIKKRVRGIDDDGAGGLFAV